MDDFIEDDFDLDLEFEDDWKMPEHEEQRMEPTFKQMQHVGFVGPVIGGRVEGQLAKRKKRIAQTPLENFLEDVDGISRNFEAKGILEISEYEIQDMLEIARKVKYVEHKNPWAYILGYKASNGGNNINRISVDYVFSRLHLVVDGSVKQPDVIRYARYWLELKEK